MDFNYQNMKVRDILGCDNKQLKIPRYQRDYSWEKEEIEEFINDILLQITVGADKKIINGDYFFGTILLAGSFADSSKIIEIVDGQQRVTTMTIFLSVLAKSFYELNNEKLGNLVWKYVMKTDDDGEIYKALSNDTADDYFAYLVQILDECELEVVDEEQEKIKYAYDYFTKILKEVELRKKIKALNKKIDVQEVGYLELLKLIRNQLLDSTIICLSTKDKNSANSIFEILNGKGKKLDSIDLIKNNIFSKVNTTEPTDNANNIWRKIRKELVSRKENIEFSTFYRHYWISKYKKVSDDQLYKEFINKVDEEDYSNFLNNLYKSAKQYVKIINPTLNDYSDRKEYRQIVEALKYLNDYFNIKQIRVLLLSLFEAKFEKDIVSFKNFKEILMYLHGFHFVYNALCTKRSNALESKYSKFAIQLSNAKNQNEAAEIIKNLKGDLDKLFPSYTEFEKAFIKLEYSKKKNQTNMLSKYVLNNLEKCYSDLNFEQPEGSVEHILGESKEVYTLNIGNLILLEMSLNRQAENKSISDKFEIYKKSSYECIRLFIDKYSEVQKWDEDNISERAKDMAKLYYQNVLKRDI